MDTHTLGEDKLVLFHERRRKVYLFWHHNQLTLSYLLDQQISLPPQFFVSFIIVVKYRIFHSKQFLKF